MSVLGVEFVPYSVIGNAFPGHKGRPGQRGGSAPREGGDAAAPAPSSPAPASGPSLIQAAVSAAAGHGAQHESEGGGAEQGHEHGGEATPAKIASIVNEVGHLREFVHGVGEAMFKGGHEAVKGAARALASEHAAHGHAAVAGHELAGGEHAAGAEAGAEHGGGGVFGKASMLLAAAGGIVGGKIAEGMERALHLDQAYNHLYQQMKSEHGEEEARTLALGAKVTSLAIKTALVTALGHLGFGGKALMAAGTVAGSIVGKGRSKTTKFLRSGAAEGIAAGALGAFGEHVAEAATEGLAGMTAFSIPGVAFVSLYASHMLGKVYDALHNAAEARGIPLSRVTGPTARLHRYLAHSTLGKATEKIVHGVHEHLEHITGLQLKGEAELIKEHGKAIGSGLHRFARAAGSKARSLGGRLRGSKSPPPATANSVIGSYLRNATALPAAPTGPDATNPVDSSNLTVANPAVQHYIGIMRDVLKTLLSTPQGQQLWSDLNTPQGAQAVMALMHRGDRHLEVLGA